jgi:hypothetical protein
MGLFDDIKNKIFGTPHGAATPGLNAATSAAAESIGVEAAKRVAAATPAPKPAAVPTPAATPVAQAAPATAPASAASAVDVAAVLDAAVAKSGQKLDWRKSIVDLLKALGLDSSLSARKTLSSELGYTGDTDDSAKMNVWLHKQVVQKLKDNGGKVPADLL